MIMLPIDAAALSAAFPDWRISENGETCQAIGQQPESGAGCSRRVAALGKRELTSDSLSGLAVQLAMLEFPLGITPAS